MSENVRNTINKTSNTLWGIAGIGLGVAAAYCGVKAAIATVQLIKDDLKAAKTAKFGKVDSAKVEAEAAQAPVVDFDNVEKEGD